MTDFKNLNTIDKIRGHFAKDISGPTLKHFFDHSQVGTDIEKAREVAVLLEKLQLAEKANLPDKGLLKEIELAKTQGTVAYNVLITRQRPNALDFVNSAIKRLKELAGKFSTFDSLNEDFTLLKSALKDHKTKLAELLKLEEKFTPIKEAIEASIKKDAEFDNLINREQKVLVEFKDRLEDLKKKQKELKDNPNSDPAMRTYKTFSDKMSQWIARTATEADSNNRFEILISDKPRQSIIGAEFRTVFLHYYIKEILEKIEDPAAVNDYLIANGTAVANRATHEATWKTITDITKNMTLGKEKEAIEEAEKHLFKLRVDKTGGKERKIWDVTVNFNRQNAGVPNIFPYEAFFNLMESWFPANSAAFKDDNNNPFKQKGLLGNNFKIDYALLGEKIDKDHSPDGQKGEWYKNSSTQRDTVDFKDLESAVKGFHDLLNTNTNANVNRARFLHTTTLASWQATSGLAGFHSGYNPAGDTNKFFDDLTKKELESLENPEKFLELQIQVLEGEVQKAEASVNVNINRKIEKSTFHEQEEKLNDLADDVKTLKESSLTILLDKAREYYKDTNNGSNLKVLTMEGMLHIVKYLGEIKKINGSLDDSDQEILTKVEALKVQVDAHTTMQNRYGNFPGSNFQEKLQHFTDEQFARDLHAEWTKVDALITLVNGNKRDFEALCKLIEQLDKNEITWEQAQAKAPDAPEKTPKLTNEEVQTAIVAAHNESAKPDENIAETWTGFNNTKSKLATIENIRDWIKANIVDKKTEFLAHVDAKLPNDKPANGTEDERVANFLKSQTAEKVIKAVISHSIETEDYKKNVINAIEKAKKNAKDEPLNLEKYGNSTIEKPSEEFIIQFDYEQITGKEHEYLTRKQEKNDNGDKTEGFWNRYIARYWYAPLWVPVLLAGLAIFYFWDNISNWWNGPAEEGADVEEESK